MRRESEILRAVLDYLTVRKVFHFRVNNTGVFDPSKKIFRKPHNITPGVSDIICVRQGLIICIEVKSSSGFQSQAQKEFEAGVYNNGGQYHVVRSVDDVIKIGL